ncbi:hypothetical protein BDW75DRAFT_244929 [Aspergillus navahoensis]
MARRTSRPRSDRWTTKEDEDLLLFIKIYGNIGDKDLLTEIRKGGWFPNRTTGALRMRIKRLGQRQPIIQLNRQPPKRPDMFELQHPLKHHEVSKDDDDKVSEDNSIVDSGDIDFDGRVRPLATPRCRTRCPRRSYSICTSRPSAEPEKESVPAAAQLNDMIYEKPSRSEEGCKPHCKKLMQSDDELAKYRDQLASARNQISDLKKQCRELYRQLVKERTIHRREIVAITRKARNSSY